MTVDAAIVRGMVLALQSEFGSAWRRRIATPEPANSAWVHSIAVISGLPEGDWRGGLELIYRTVLGTELRPVPKVNLRTFVVPSAIPLIVPGTQDNARANSLEIGAPVIGAPSFTSIGSDHVTLMDVDGALLTDSDDALLFENI